MSLVRVHNFSVSLDGFGVGEGQRREAPFGHAGHRLLEWAIATRTFTQMGFHGDQEGTVGIDEAFASRWNTGVGAEIMGRNKFGPHRGPWEDHEWKGWWGDVPPFHTPVFVLTHHLRPSFTLDDTTFHFIDASPTEAFARAAEAADGRDVRLGGGVATVREFLDDDLVDAMHVAMAPVDLGRGERLWDRPEDLLDRFHMEKVPSPSSGVVHHIFWRR